MAKGQKRTLSFVRHGGHVHKIERINHPNPLYGGLPIRAVTVRCKKHPIPPGWKPVKKGEVRNPWGRRGKSGTGGMPKFMRGFVSVGRALRTLSEIPYEDPAFVKRYGNGIPVGQAIALTTIAAAIKSDHFARDFFAERTEGKVTQPIQVNDASIRITINGPVEQKRRAATLNEKIVPSDGPGDADAST